MHKPITVLMPVFNCESFLENSIESILNQTFEDFEFLIINDGSTDKSEEIIKSYSDNRIKYIKNDKNISLSKTLKKGVMLAQSNLIARMDADDISLKKRLEKQYFIFNDSKDLDLLGANIRYINNNGIIYGSPNIITDNIEIKWRIFFRNCFNHPTVMFKKSSLLKYNLNYGTYLPVLGNYFKKGILGIGDEDYLLFGQMTILGNVMNISDILLNYRIHKKSLTSLNSQEQSIQSKNISHYLVNYWISKNKFINYKHNKNKLVKLYDKFIREGKKINIIADFYNVEMLFHEKHVNLILRILKSIKIFLNLNFKSKEMTKLLIKYIIGKK